VRFLDGGGPVAFTIDGSVATDPWNMILVAYNGEATPATLSLPAGSWQVVVDAKTAGTETVRTVSGEVRLPPWSMLVARRP
jgi:pullulanase/glycogen debranching enzyme